MKKYFVTVLRENRSLLLFLVLMLIFRSSFADWNVVPTGSMQPTIVEGDRILVNKLAYDLRLPFSDITLVHHADPKRGDIVIFNSKIADDRLVKRVIGLPGEVVAMYDNRLWINGQRMKYQTLAPSEGLNKPAQRGSPTMHDTQETLFSLRHRIRTSAGKSPSASFSPVIIPENHYLVLGDNRDNSADSRVIGFVPRKEIIGRSQTVVMSLDANHYYKPRTERFWLTL